MFKMVKSSHRGHLPLRTHQSTEQSNEHFSLSLAPTVTSSRQVSDSPAQHAPLEAHRKHAAAHISHIPHPGGKEPSIGRNIRHVAVACPAPACLVHVELPDVARQALELSVQEVELSSPQVAEAVQTQARQACCSAVGSRGSLPACRAKVRSSEEVSKAWPMEVSSEPSRD